MKAVIHSDAEREQILASIYGHRPEQARALLQFSWATGLRTAEMAQIEIRDIVLTANPKLIVRAKISKTGVARELPLTQEAIKAIAVLRGDRQNGNLIVGRQDKPYSPHSLSERFKKLYEMSGIKGTAYSGRRGVATRLSNAGAPMRVIQEVLGHLHIGTTQRYCETTPEAVMHWMQKVA